MKEIKIEKIKCEVPAESKLIGFVFETEKHYIINIHQESCEARELKMVG